MIDTAVILATGNPEHTSALIQERPRAMLPALGKPMVVRVMEQLYRASIRRFIVIAGLNEGEVASYLRKQWVPDAKIEFMLQSSSSNLSQVLVDIAKKLGKPFMLTSYNSFTYERFIRTLLKHHEEYPQHFILAGAHSTLSRSANHAYAVMEGQYIRQIVSTPPDTAEHHYILTDIAVCGQNFVNYLINRHTYDRSTVYFMDIVRQYLDSYNPQAIIGETSWLLQVETDSDLLVLNKYLLDDINDAHILSELPPSVRVIPPVRIDPQVRVGNEATIGPHVYLERGSSVGASARVSNAIVIDRGVILPKEDVTGAIVTRNGKIR